MDHWFLQNKVSKERVQRSGSDRITARLSMKRRRTVEKKLKFELSASAFIPSGDKKIHFEGSRGPSVAAGPGVAYPLTPLSTALALSACVVLLALLPLLSLCCRRCVFRSTSIHSCCWRWLSACRCRPTAHLADTKWTWRLPLSSRTLAVVNWSCCRRNGQITRSART